MPLAMDLKSPFIFCVQVYDVHFSNSSTKCSLVDEVTPSPTRHEPVACRELPLWCKKAFDLMKIPGKPTVTLFLKEAKEALATRRQKSL